MSHFIIHIGNNNNNNNNNIIIISIITSFINIVYYVNK